MTKKMPWFACYPEKWLNALAEMKPDIGYVYWIICLRIYERQGPIQDTNQALARRTGYRPTHIARAIDHLCGLGKLTRTADGLMNPFAERELQTQRRRHSDKIEPTTGVESSKITQTNQRPDQLQLHIQEERKKERGHAQRRAARIPMPEDWRPADKGVVYATERGFQESRVEQMIRACRDYHLKHGTLIAGEVGLAATWRTWVENEIKFTREQRNGPGRSGAFQDDSRSLVKAADRLIEKAQRGEFTFGPRPGLPVETGEDAVRLLPQGGSGRP